MRLIPRVVPIARGTRTPDFGPRTSDIGVRHPREGGDPSFRRFLDSRLRGKDTVAAPDAGPRTPDPGRSLDSRLRGKDTVAAPDAGPRTPDPGRSLDYRLRGKDTVAAPDAGPRTPDPGRSLDYRLRGKDTVAAPDAGPRTPDPGRSLDYRLRGKDTVAAPDAGPRTPDPGRSLDYRLRGKDTVAAPNAGPRTPDPGRSLDYRLRGNDTVAPPDSGLRTPDPGRSLDYRLRGNDTVAPPDSGLRTPDARRKFAFCILIFAFLASAASGQSLNQQEIPNPLASRTISPRFTHLRLEDGLSQSAVYHILQDRKGFMWFSTQDGLNRYDGYNIKIYRPHPFDSTGLSDGWIWSTMEDHDGDLWVSTHSGGLNRMDRTTETFKQFRHDPDDPTSLASDAVWASYEDRDGIIWVATEAGVDRMDDQRTGKFTHYKNDPSDQHSLSNNVVYYIYQDLAGSLWFSTANGLNRMDPAKPGVFDRFFAGPPESVTVKDEVDTPLERPEEPGILWVGTVQGLVRLETETGKFDRYFPTKPDPNNPMINAIFYTVLDPANPGVIWVSTMGSGIGRFDIRARKFVMYRNEPGNPNSLSSNVVQAVFADRSGMVWAGTQQSGVDRFNPSQAGVEHLRSNAADPNSLPDKSAWGISETRDGFLWVGTNDGTLTALDRSAGKATYYRPNAANPHAKSAANPVAIVEDRFGYVWINARGGTDRLDRRTGRFKHYRTDPKDEHSISGSAPSIMEDRLGNLWFGDAQGVLNRYDRENDRFYRYPLRDTTRLGSDVSLHARELVEDLAGFIWVATDSGVLRFNPESGRVEAWIHDPNDPKSPSAPNINSIVERQREPGIIWFGTQGGGLNRLDASTGDIRFYTDRDGLANNVVYGILEDENGLLWMSTNHGISRFNPDTETFRNYGLEIGLQSLEFNGSSYYRSRSGELFFGGVNGLNAFYPNQLADNMTPPQVAVVDLKLFNRSITDSGVVKLDHPIEDTHEITLDYSQKEVTFDFVAFHYADPGSNSFAYRLEGFNDDWVYTGNQRTASFTNLSPGEYIFRVKAANSDGVWNEEGTSLHLTITPPFWATWWFRLLAVLGFGGLLYAGYAFRVRQIAERNRALESEVDKRTAELNESKERLELTNEQLEQSHTIVEAINQETSFRRLLTKIMEEARVIPGVEKATALVRLPDDLFHVRASSGWDVGEMQHISLTPKQAHQRYVEESEEVGKNIFVAKNVTERAGMEKMADFGKVASFLVLRVMVEGDVRAYLVFDNLTDPDAFDQGDVALLERLREHIQSAFIKTSILEDLQHTLDDLRTTQDRLIQSEKMASLGQLTAGIAHEIKNPLNFVNNFSDMTAELATELTEEMDRLKQELPADKLEELASIVESLSLNAKKIGEHGKRADAIVTNMLEHSKVGEGERSTTDLNELLDEYVTLARHGLEARGGGFEVDVERSYDESVGRVDVVPQDMGRVFMNLLSNAFDALKEHGARNGTPTVSVSTAKVDGAVEIRVKDNGPGIPEKVRARIFEPFFTTKPTGSGTGLGLSMAYDIVTKGHGGTLDVESEEGQGATFVVRLPV